MLVRPLFYLSARENISCLLCTWRPGLTKGIVTDNNTELSLLDYDLMSSEAELQGFRTFIDDICPIPDAFEFPGKLSRLYLPDLTAGKLCNMTDTFKALFATLADEDTFNIQKIYRISAKDNPKDPVAYESIAEWVAEFQVEYLDWVTYDPDIQPLIDFSAEGALSLRDITLYSSGDMEILKNWLSAKGLLSINTVSCPSAVAFPPWAIKLRLTKPH